jgi:hydrogenase expression/formation protein HypE
LKDKILLAHGSGGRLAHALIDEILVPAVKNPILERLHDSATMDVSGRLAFTTDSYVVQPIFFPGGDIGRLAVCGTVNDLAMAGARPLFLSLALIIEEGFPVESLRQVMGSVKAAADEAGVAIVTGDTKVVNRGSADGLFVNTAGIGLVPPGVDIGGERARPGDKVLLSGSIGDHGIAVLSKREGLAFSAPIVSDCAPLHSLVAAMLDVCPEIRVLRDPTRGGLATTLNEIARASGVEIRIDERQIPVKPAVLGACEMLGFDPLYVANEGKLAAIVPAAAADGILAAMRTHPHGQDAVLLGEVTGGPSSGRVVMKTLMGASRVVDMLSGDLLPRIC